MRLLTLPEVLIIAEAVTGIDAEILVRVSRIELLESAIAAPQAGFGDYELYPEFVDKAAVLCSRIVGNHALPDGNKRLGWQSLVVFCDINGYELMAEPDEAVEFIQSLAAGIISEPQLAEWIRSHIQTE